LIASYIPFSNPLTAVFCRHIQPVINKIKAVHPCTPISFVNFNLSSRTSTHKAAADITDLVLCIDVLINNSTIALGPYSKTEDGIDSQFGTNHIGHFLLTNLLNPKILAAKPDARILNVSSSAHCRATCPAGEDYNFSDSATYNELEGYSQFKAANVLFTNSLAQNPSSHIVQIIFLHPRSIQGRLQKHASKTVWLKH
jgi:NAD(P)-dependent dehydrogenase (short-subunit alcohol dehydrogenase family)